MSVQGVRGQFGAASTSVNFIICDSGIVRGLNLNNPPQELDVIRVNPFEVFILKCERIQSIGKGGDKNRLKDFKSFSIWQVTVPN